MSKAQFSSLIAAPFETIWQVLMDEVEAPQNYNPGILASEIFERFHDGVLRLVKVPDADVREKVVFNYEKRQIQSNLVGHPSLVGVLTQSVFPHEDDGHAPSYRIDCTLEWDSIDESIDKMIRRNMETFFMRGLENVKRKAEAQARKEQAQGGK